MNRKNIIMNKNVIKYLHKFYIVDKKQSIPGQAKCEIIGMGLDIK